MSDAQLKEKEESSTTVVENKDDMILDTLPETGGGIVSSLSSPNNAIDAQLFLADNIEKLIAAQNKIRIAILKLAQPHDWCVFGSGESAKAELGFAGAMRIASVVGISFVNWVGKKESGRDELGEWYRYEFECDAIFRGKTVRVYGRAGSRDKFFGKKGGEYKQLHDIDEGNIKIAARRSAMKEGVKVLLGLHHIDPAFLKNQGVILSFAGGYEFKPASSSSSSADNDNGKGDAEVTESISTKIADVVIGKKGDEKKGEKWTKYKITDEKGISYNTFSESFAKVAKELKENGNTAIIIFKKTKFGNDIKSLSADESEAYQ